MLKYIGAVIVCVSGFVLGLKKAFIVEERLELLNEFEKSVLLLRGEIRYSSATLPEAVLSVGNRINGSLKNFYNSLYECLMNSPGISFAKLWEEQCELFFDKEEIHSDDKKMFMELGKLLGHLDIDMQLKNIELCISRLKEQQKNAAEDIKNKSKLYKTIGLSGGALLTLLLL